MLPFAGASVKRRRRGGIRGSGFGIRGAGKSISSCNTSNDLAFPPARIVRFAAEFGSRAIVRSICSTDWTATMEDLAQLIVDRVAERFPGPDSACSL